MISIVCVYNNKEVLNDFLIKSLKNQSVNYELILMDNTTGNFSSAASALNKGGKKAKGKYVMFVHQDIDLESSEWLEDTEKTLDSLENLGIAGVAGIAKWDEDVTSNITHDIPPKRVSERVINSPVEVQTLDECLFIIPRSVFEILKFDEAVCDDWHLYSVDYSLSIKKRGYNVYVIPSNLYHRSPGDSLSDKYEISLKKLLKKHRNNYNAIFTTMGEWVTIYPLNVQARLPWLKDKTMKLYKRIEK